VGWVVFGKVARSNLSIVLSNPLFARRVPNPAESPDPAKTPTNKAPREYRHTPSNNGNLHKNEKLI
jgi:hypothetical protein